MHTCPLQEGFFVLSAIPLWVQAVKGFEVMRMFKKGQFAPWIDAICGGTEARFINRLFGLYA